MNPRQLAPLLCALLLLGTTPAARAQNLLWAAPHGEVATAGSGLWDENFTASWRDNLPTGPRVRWSQNRTAVFAGSGGEIGMSAVISADGLQFRAGAGPFTIRDAGQFTIIGSGISCEAATLQTLDVSRGILIFSEHASAAAGAQASRVKIVADGVVNFTATSTAGRAQIVSPGELEFADHSSAGSAAIAASGHLSFSGSASAGRAEITSSGLLSFENQASAGAAAITNRGHFSIADDVQHFEAASINNAEDSALDLSGLHSTAALRIGSLTNAQNATIHLGHSPVEVSALVLVRENQLSFHFAAKGPGGIRVTRALLADPGGQMLVAVVDTGVRPEPGTYPLLDWSRAAFTSGAELYHFALQPLPAGWHAQLRIVDRRLLLELQSIDAPAE